MIRWKPWEPFLDWVTSPEPPAHQRNYPLHVANWKKAWELRQALDEAASTTAGRSWNIQGNRT
jgi:hypothetical protein